MSQSVVPALPEIQRGPDRKSGSFNHQLRNYFSPQDHCTGILDYLCIKRPLRLESIDFK
uniref:Uncharacterized protein n=1 Tax=Callithrix jacchus TaxID=9483 RepID=A0A2R8MHD4_CALJA